MVSAAVEHGSMPAHSTVTMECTLPMPDKASEQADRINIKIDYDIKTRIMK